jgi:hypothetical protein
LLAAAERKPRSKPDQLIIDYPMRLVCAIFVSLFAQEDFGLLGRSAGNQARTRYTSSVLGVLTAHKMPGAGPFMHHFAAASNLNTFAQTFVSLLLTHITQLFQYNLKHAILGVLRRMSRLECRKSSEKRQIDAKLPAQSRHYSPETQIPLHTIGIKPPRRRASKNELNTCPHLKTALKIALFRSFWH